MPQNFLLTRALLSVALLGSLWVRVTLARSPALSGSKLLSLSGNRWLSMVISGSHCLPWALSGSYQLLSALIRHLLGLLKSYLRCSAVSSPGCSSSLGSQVFKKRLVLNIRHN